MHTVYVYYIAQEVRYFGLSCFYFAVTSKNGFYFDFFFLFLHSGESAISNILAVGWRNILHNPGLPYDWMKLSPRQATLDNPDPIMQNTTLCCLELYVPFTVRFKMERRVRGVLGERLTYTTTHRHTTTRGCHHIKRS
jgi:hypothetical protein